MQELPSVYVGIDVSKAHLDSSLQLSSGKLLGRFDNTQKGFTKLGKAVRSWQPAATLPHLVLEATGGYEQRLVAWARQQNWRVTLVDPVKVRKWAEVDGQRNKTDPLDSLALAGYGAAKQVEHQQPLADHLVELEQLLSLQEDLKQQQLAENNRLEQWRQRANPSETVLASLERRLQHLETERKAVQQAIRDLLKQHPDLRRQRRRLLTVPGIGSRNVLWLLLHFARFDTLTNGTGSQQAVTAYTGLDPRHQLSGKRIYKRSTISKMGNRTVRCYAFMGAFGGVTGNNPLRDFYRRLVGRGKAKRLALVACARKVIVWGWHVFKQDVDFDPSRHRNAQIASAVA